jgi:hypothetical protein
VRQTDQQLLLLCDFRGGVEILRGVNIGFDLLRQRYDDSRQPEPQDHKPPPGGSVDTVRWLFDEHGYTRIREQQHHQWHDEQSGKRRFAERQTEQHFTLRDPGLEEAQHAGQNEARQQRADVAGHGVQKRDAADEHSDRELKIVSHRRFSRKGSATD